MKRKKQSAAARVRPYWFLLAVVAILAAAGGYWAATWPGFLPTHVAITGNHVVPASQIAQRAQISPHENLWLQNMRAAQSRIDAIPSVKEAYIHRTLPAGVEIAITERAPYAILCYGEGDVLVDRDLRVLRQDPDAGSLPEFVMKAQLMPQAGQFVKDQDAARLRDDYEALNQAHVVVRLVQYDKFGDLIATMHTGVRLLLGDDSDLQTKIALVGPILSQVAAGGRRIAAVDLRAPKTPVVVYAH